MNDDSHTLQPNTTFGKHRVVRLLGRGGMGEVYEVEHELTGELHALKLLSREMMEVSGALERFQKEAKVMARLKHHGIVKVNSAGEDEGRHWLRMELMNGREVNGRQAVTLEEYVEAKGGRLPEKQVMALLKDLLDALGHAHAKGLVHRDLKPANVLFDGDKVKIADFGLVNAAGADWMETQVLSTVISPDEEETLIDSAGTGARSRALMGTYAFMSPEQKKGLPADARSDLYALGLMTFRMLTGEESGGFELPTELVEGISKGWNGWVKQALKIDPHKRFTSATAMQEALDFQASTTEKPISATELVTPPFKENPTESEASTGAGIPLEMRVYGAGMLLWCPPGTFEMGSTVGEMLREDDERQFRVTLTEGFWLGKHAITQAQWETIMANPSSFKGPNFPVEQVSWDEALSFCKKLTEREWKAGRLPEGYAYQLPTEAQWEYACRAGTKTAFAFGDSLSSKQANFDGNYPYGGAAKGVYLEKTASVGSYPANAWGFHDMHGNVWEWCQDWYGEYPSGTACDPMGPASGSLRVGRGGSWGIDGHNLRSAERLSLTPTHHVNTLGFRISLRLIEQ